MVLTADGMDKLLSGKTLMSQMESGMMQENCIIGPVLAVDVLTSNCGNVAIMMKVARSPTDTDKSEYMWVSAT